MQLCYRGAKYQSQANSGKTVETTNLGVTARFLGQTYTLRLANHPSSLSAEVLKYRGIVYQK